MYNDFYDSAYYGAESINEAATFSTAMMGLFAGIWIFTLILSLIYLISYWKIFVKANKPGWASIVPIYSNIVMIEIAKLPMWYIALFFVPIANIYAIFKINIEIAKKFGKETGFGIGMTLLPIIFIPLLAFSDNVYEDNKKETSTGSNTFDATNVINNTIEPQNVTSNNNFNNVSSIPVENNMVNEVNVETNIAAESITPVDNIQTSNIEIEPATDNNTFNQYQENIEVSNEPAFNSDPINNIPEFKSVKNSENQVNPIENTSIVDDANTNQITENLEVRNEFVANDNSVIEQNIAPNAFNSKPILSETTNETVITESLENINVEPQISEPVIIEPLNNSEETKNEPLINTLNNNLTDNKFCKNCGNELPNIVSICPNCGTDNE